MQIVDDDSQSCLSPHAFKKMTASFSEAEKDAMFRGTATRVYGL